MILPKKHLRDIERTAYPIKSRSTKITLDRNERTVDFPPELIEELRELLTGFVLRGYPEMDQFYETLSKWSGFSTDQLLATDGADGGLHRVFATYVSEGDEVVVLSPSYSMYPVYCRMYGAHTHPLTFDESLDLPFEKVFASARPGVRLLALANPNQPIESCYSLEELLQLAKRCAEYDVLLMVDEAYYHFCGITAAPLVYDFENVVVVRTLSKAFGLAGLRIGYMIAAPPTIKALRALKPIYEINHLNAAIAAHLLKKSKLMEDYVSSVRLGRDALKEFFAHYKCEVYGQHTNTILVRLPKTVLVHSLTSALRSIGWLVKAETERPLSNHLRITIGPVGQMKQLCQLIKPYLTGEKSLGNSVLLP